MREAGYTDVISWTLMILALNRNGSIEQVWELFEDMKHNGIKPDTITWASLVSACAELATLGIGKRIHKQILDSKIPLNQTLQTALINMYAKCGSLEDARRLFSEMRRNTKGDTIAWTAMINAYGQHGEGKEALKLFHEMQNIGVNPDLQTLVAVLNACSHSALVEEALNLYKTMEDQFNIRPNEYHLTCIVDSLGRAGRLEEAQQLIETSAQPNAIIAWKTLLGACRVHADVNRAEYVSEQILKLDPSDSSNYVLLSNIYAAAGKFPEVSKVRQKMQEKNIKKQPGMSWIEIDGTVHKFVVHDQSHERSDEIYAELDSLFKEMRLCGYKPDTSFVLHDVALEEKEKLLCYHSEKLAIGLALISTPPFAPITVMKNLRVCGDCHTATKFISKIRNRQITLRDANRFHHFKDGKCSCNDYF